MNRRGFLSFLAAAPLAAAVKPTAVAAANDSVLMMLSPGEFHIPADTFKHYGADLIRALNFRTRGPWGEGSGAALAPADIDNNFRTLAEAIEDLSNGLPRKA